ncbi:MAG: ABC transporter ATP-binding protein [Salinicola sp.]|uniref:ABC transporter ATP-binding protein n=1 Tax=Salinicola sp. TaxID=1978524 RepID=UPI001DF01B64|nr:ABC transporter ATP-binding protein [Salinicola sp.]NRB56321.1 ABC transporter ATP-binding protein [Salinicola sp.]
MIEIQNLYKRYHGPHGGDWVLKDINLTIPDGISVGVVGRNGAGKSTLLRLIGGMDAPDRGRVIRKGRVSWPIGLAGGFKGSMTGRQNVKFVARVHGIKKSLHQLIQEVQDFAEIGKAFDDPVNTYSSGMRARLAFGLSLAFDFDIYISDEATAVGDRAFKAKAREAFQQRVDHASLIMVSHGEGTLRQMCEAGIFIDQGQAHWFDRIDDAIEAYHRATGLITDVADEDDDDYEAPLPTDPRSIDEQMKALRRESAQIHKQQIIAEYRQESATDEATIAEIKRERRELRDKRLSVKHRFRALKQHKREIEQKAPSQ